jgi:hypothetical protein
MEDVRFDALTRAFSKRIDRRAAIRGFFGIGGAALAQTLIGHDADAARRGYSGPKTPKPTQPGLCAAGVDTCLGGAMCNDGTALCMPGYDTPNLNFCVIGMSVTHGQCGSCQTHFDCSRLTGDQHSPCVLHDENCHDCAAAGGGACAVLQP